MNTVFGAMRGFNASIARFLYLNLFSLNHLPLLDRLYIGIGCCPLGRISFLKRFNESWVL